jgi:hypothetical protein
VGFADMPDAIGLTCCLLLALVLQTALIIVQVTLHPSPLVRYDRGDSSDERCRAYRHPRN